MSYGFIYERLKAEAEQRRAEAGAICEECRTPYVLDDLHSIGVGRYVCRWHFNRRHTP